jgi:class 3 adenylate cyclase
VTLKDTLQSDINDIFKIIENWDVTTGRVVPSPESVGFGNKAVFLEKAVVVYADLDGSTNMVDTKKWAFSAEVYKAFLSCSAKIIKSESGDITAYDGDRIMGIFAGDGKCDRAVRAAMKINWTVKTLIKEVRERYWSSDYVLKHVVGIDMSDLRAVRTGVRGDNDLVWVGRAANYAAKLTTLSSDYPTWITKDVFDALTRNEASEASSFFRVTRK